MGYLGAFLLGVIFALSFCPFSAVLFFAMLIPLALGAGDPVIIPAVFAVATGFAGYRDLVYSCPGYQAMQRNHSEDRSCGKLDTEIGGSSFHRGRDLLYRCYLRNRALVVSHICDGNLVPLQIIYRTCNDYRS